MGLRSCARAPSKSKPHLPPAMTRFSSLVAIAAVATVTSDALVPGADAAIFPTRGVIDVEEADAFERFKNNFDDFDFNGIDVQEADAFERFKNNFVSFSFKNNNNDGDNDNGNFGVNNVGGVGSNGNGNGNNNGK